LLEQHTRVFYVNDAPREATVAEINSNYLGDCLRLDEIKEE
jgi:hypothetical protein